MNLLLYRHLWRASIAGFPDYEEVWLKKPAAEPTRPLVGTKLINETQVAVHRRSLSGRTKCARLLQEIPRHPSLPSPV